MAKPTMRTCARARPLGNLSFPRVAAHWLPCRKGLLRRGSSALRLRGPQPLRLPESAGSLALATVQPRLVAIRAKRWLPSAGLGGRSGEGWQSRAAGATVSLLPHCRWCLKRQPCVSDTYAPAPRNSPSFQEQAEGGASKAFPCVVQRASPAV